MRTLFMTILICATNCGMERISPPDPEPYCIPLTCNNTELRQKSGHLTAHTSPSPPVRDHTKNIIKLKKYLLLSSLSKTQELCTYDRYHNKMILLSYTTGLFQNLPKIKFSRSPKGRHLICTENKHHAPANQTYVRIFDLEQGITYSYVDSLCYNAFTISDDGNFFAGIYHQDSQNKLIVQRFFPQMTTQIDIDSGIIKSINFNNQNKKLVLNYGPKKIIYVDVCQD